MLRIKIKKILPIAILLLLTSFIHAQSIRGTVTSESGEKLPGATISLKGTTIGTITDNDGNFTLETGAGDGESKTLVISFIGFLTEEVKLDGRDFYNITLREDVQSLEEVVVVGYGTQQKSDITGAVASVDKTRIEEMVNTEVAQIIQGSIPGLTMMSTAAGAAPSDENSLILIRGRNSISADNYPLIIVDGIPYEGELSDLNPNDIESIEVLKDASSAAIYGSRGANGVILITSRKGKAGKLTLEYDGYYSVQNVASFPDIMNGDEYFDYKKNWTDVGGETGEDDAAISDSEREVYESGKATNWRKVLLRQGTSQQHNLGISGGTEKVNWFASTSYFNVKGIAINDDYTRVTSSIKLNASLNSWLSYGTSNRLSYTDKSGSSPSFSAVFRMSPLVRAYNEDGSINITPLPDNPQKKSPLENLLYDDVDKKYQVLSNNYLDIDIPTIKGLSYRFNTGIRYSHNHKAYYAGMNTVAGQNVGSEGSVSGGPELSVTIENIASYKRKIGKHNLFLTGLYGYEQRNEDIRISYAKSFANDFMKWYGMPQALFNQTTYDYSREVLVSQMFRLNYSYDSRYLLTLTARRDGYSGFGKETKWGIFPSLALGWNIANESFFNLNDIINVLKLRFSIGENGNQAVKPYQTIDRLAISNYLVGSQTAPGYIPSDIGVPNLGWETTRSTNIGIDYALFNSKITGDINLYNNDTYDLLLERMISPVLGDDKIFQNVGKTNNQGFEFSVLSRNISQNNFKWTTNANFSVSKNKIVELQYGEEMDDVASKLFIGEPIASNYDYKIIGVWQKQDSIQASWHGAKPGYARYEDFKQDSLLTPDDRKIIGHRDPTVTWGLTNSVTYKNFILSVFVYGMHGITKPNPIKQANVFVNQNWWTPDNPTNEMWDKDDRMANSYWVDGGVDIYEKAGFVRIKDITLNYKFPDRFFKKKTLQSATIFISGKNLFTITNYDGMDPELDTQRAIPLQREFLIGLKVGL